jgi:hypothetical protein
MTRDLIYEEVLEAERFQRNRRANYLSISACGGVGAYLSQTVATAISASHPALAAGFACAASVAVVTAVYYLFKSDKAEKEANRVAKIVNLMKETGADLIPAHEILGKRPKQFSKFVYQLNKPA